MALIDTILQKGHYSYQKYHLTKLAANINGKSQEMAPHKNDISQKWHLKTFLIGFLNYYQHSA